MNAARDISSAEGPPSFDEGFREALEALHQWRRDVRRFKPDPVSSELVHELLSLAALAPSVGNSQPWRFVNVTSTERRQAVIADFERCNADALADYDGERAESYAQLKLSGMRDAPVHLAVFCDQGTHHGLGLGQKTMPETLAYSVVGAINALWLAARAHGIGLGWVSILDPDTIADILDVPQDWTLIAYLCLGYPVEEHIDPELVRHGWQDRIDASEFIFER